MVRNKRQNGGFEWQQHQQLTTTQMRGFVFQRQFCGNSNISFSNRVLN